MLLIPFHRLTGGAFVRASVLALEGVSSKSCFDGVLMEAGYWLRDRTEFQVLWSFRST